MKQLSIHLEHLQCSSRFDGISVFKRAGAISLERCLTGLLGISGTQEAGDGGARNLLLVAGALREDELLVVRSPKLSILKPGVTGEMLDEAYCWKFDWSAEIGEEC